MSGSARTFGRRPRGWGRAEVSWQGRGGGASAPRRSMGAEARREPGAGREGRGELHTRTWLSARGRSSGLCRAEAIDVDAPLRGVDDEVGEEVGAALLDVRHLFTHPFWRPLWEAFLQSSVGAERARQERLELRGGSAMRCSANEAGRCARRGREEGRSAPGNSAAGCSRATDPL